MKKLTEAQLDCLFAGYVLEPTQADVLFGPIEGIKGSSSYCAAAAVPGSFLARLSYRVDLVQELSILTVPGSAEVALLLTVQGGTSQLRVLYRLVDLAVQILCLTAVQHGSLRTLLLPEAPEDAYALVTGFSLQLAEQLQMAMRSATGQRPSLSSFQDFVETHLHRSAVPSLVASLPVGDVICVAITALCDFIPSSAARN